MNNGTKIKVKGLSRYEIRKICNEIKEKFGLKNKKIDIIKFLELFILLINYEYEIVEDEKLRMNYADFNPNEKRLRIRESTYIGAKEGKARDRFTVAHELGHIILHSMHNPGIKFCRLEENIKPYEDIEWQANTFAAEFLVDIEEVENLTVEKIAEKFGVSKEVAKIQKNIICNKVIYKKNSLTNGNL